MIRHVLDDYADLADLDEIRIIGPERLIHAFPNDSDIALCGARKAKTAQPRQGVRCAVCEQHAGQKNWVSR